MRTKVLSHFHTFHPEAQAELDRLAKQERDLTLRIARRGDVEEPPKKRRASAPAENLEADLDRVRAAMEEQRKVIASGVVDITIKGLTRGEFRRLLTEHPPREDDDLDVRLGYNGDTFGDALVKACIVSTTAHELCGGEPVPNEWDTWADEMTNGQWEEVFRACLKLTNDGQPAVFPR